MSHIGRAHTVSIEEDEDGFTITLEGVDDLDGIVRVNIQDVAENLYDQARARILPWLRERDEARREYDQFTRSGTGPAAEYFACKDPEGDWIRDVALGAMGVGESLEAAAAALDSIDLSRKMERER